MKYPPIPRELFVENRNRLRGQLPPDALTVINTNDVMPTNADGTMALVPGSDLFYLTGITQEESMLLLFPDAQDPKLREILFLREPNPEMETWEGRKLSREEAVKISGVNRVDWLSAFPAIFHRLMCEAGPVFLNSNEHKRAHAIVETREARFVSDTRRQYPLHDYQRLAPIMHRLRAVKSTLEVQLLQQACRITEAGFRRVCRFAKPGVNEREIQAEFAHEFIRRGGQFAYYPIIASGKNACALHYNQNDQECKPGDLLLLDVAASFAWYNADLTRTIPVSGRFTRRQRQVYDAVLRVLRAASKAAVPGKLPKEWQREAEKSMEAELLSLGLLKPAAVRKQNPDYPALKTFFMHGIGHPLGLDVHDVTLTTEPIQEGAVLTVEPGIYIPEEGIGIRLENDVVVRKGGNLDLLASVPIEAEEIEDLMNSRQRGS